MSTLFRQETKATIRHRVGYLLFGREFIFGLATAGGAATVSLLEAAKFPNNTFNGKVVYSLEYGESSGVSASEQGTGMLTVSPAWTDIPIAGDRIEVWPEGTTPAEVDNAISQALDAASDIAPIKVHSLIAVFAVDRLSFDLPATWTHLSSIDWTENTYPTAGVNKVNRGRLDPFNYNELQYAVEGHTVYLNRAIPSSVTSINVHGYRQALPLDDDADVCEIRSDYVIFKAASLLQMDEFGTSSNDPDAHTVRSQGWTAQATDIQARMKPRFDPNTVALE